MKIIILMPLRFVRFCCLCFSVFVMVCLSWSDLDGQSTSSIEIVNGIPTLLVNNNPRNANSLFIYNVQGTYSYKSPDWLSQFKTYVDQAVNSGSTYVSFYFGLDFLAHSPGNPISSPNDLDFVKMDQFFNYAAENDIYILPVINFSNALLWWVKDNDDKLQTSYDELVDGSVGFGHLGFREAIHSNIEIIIDHYKGHEALMGWDIRIGVTAENNYGPSYLRDLDNPPESWCDYSTAALENFKSWLKQKYDDDESFLQNEWGTNGITFANVEMPEPDILTDNTFPGVLDVVNGPGDKRQAFLDWQEFRLEVKQNEYTYFIELLAKLDPDHIVAIDPASNLGMDISFVSRNGFNDFQELLHHPDVDMIVRHPRISVDESPGPFNSSASSLRTIVQNDVRAGKISTFAMEDTGERVTGLDSIDSHSRIVELSLLISSIGGNMGLVVGQSENETENGLPIFRDAELETFSNQEHLFEPENRVEINKAKVAMLIDFKGQTAMYQTMIPGFSRAFDRLAFIKSIYALENPPDLITVEEVILGQVRLEDYNGLILVHQSHLNMEVAEKIASFSLSGGRLFLAGSNGLFDSKGNNDFESFNKLVGLTPEQTYNIEPFRKVIVRAAASQIVEEQKGQELNDGNLFHCLETQWSTLGFETLAEGENVMAEKYSVLLIKDNTLVQFGNIGILTAEWKSDYYSQVLKFLEEGVVSSNVNVEYAGKFKVEIYPNPTLDWLIISSEVELSEYEVIDIKGDRKMNGNLVQHNLNLNISSLDSGVYVLHLKSKKGRQSRYFIKI